MRQAKSSTFVVDLQLPEVPACVKNVPRVAPENQSLGWRPSGSGDGAYRFSGRRPSGSWGGGGGEGGGSRVLAAPSHPTRQGLVSQRRVGFALTRHPSCVRLLRPTLSQWDLAARLVLGCSH